MDQNGWNQKVEDGDGVRAMHIDAPETDEGKREEVVNQIKYLNFRSEF